MRCTLCNRFAPPSGTCAPCAARVDAARRLLLRRLILPLAVQFAERDQVRTSPNLLQPHQTSLNLNPSDVKPTPKPAKDGDTAVSGREGIKAEELLKSAKDRAVKTLSQITRAAVLRLLADPRWLTSARSLYSPAERQQLTELLAATSATANLLGRARIRGRVNKDLMEFSEVWLKFAEEPPLQPMAPEAAVTYFKGLEPGLSPPERFGQDQRRKAFTLASVTEQSILEKVKGVILDGIQSGESTTALAQKVGQVLQAAGVHPKNPQYAELVVRTNLMDAYQTGQMQEMQSPDMKDFFPVWRYDGVNDERASEDHKRHFGKFYPNGVAFATVRGKRVWNCRCQPTPVNQFDWEDLQARGARVESGFGAVAQAPKRKKEAAVVPKPPPAEVPTPPAEPVDLTPPATVSAVPAVKPVIAPTRPIAERIKEHEQTYTWRQEFVQKHEAAKQQVEAAAKAVRGERNQLLDRIQELEKDPAKADELRQAQARFRETAAQAQQAAAAEKQLAEAHTNWLAAHVKRPVPEVPLEVHPALASKPEFQRSQQAVQAFASKVLGGATPPPARIGKTPDGREFYVNGQLALTENTPARVAVHEYGHHLEETVPGVKEAVKEFLAHRVGNEKPVALTKVAPGQGYARDEKGRKDDFDKAFTKEEAYYVGKHYPTGETEILSMGLEKLHTDPVGFAKNDPEYYHFVVGILDGSLRKTQ